MNKRLTAAAIVLALGVGGCADAGGEGTTDAGNPAGPPSGAPQVHERWTSCATAGATDGFDATDLSRLDDSFTPAAAVVCLTSPRERFGGGHDLVATEARATDLTELLAALRLPDEPRTDLPCTLEMPFVPWLALLDEHGRWVRPGVPVDACGKPRAEFRVAYAKLHTRPVSSEVVRDLDPNGAAAAGCAPDWKDELTVARRTGGGAAIPDPLPDPGATVKLCLYQVPADQRGSDLPVGAFQSGRRLTPAQWTAIRAELAAAAPGTPCAEQATRFAVLRAGPAWTVVEADGCRQVLLPPGAIRQGSAALAKALSG
ncbi:hypothetical protein BJY16_007001 [Actinoplanes octamycinicus]|uniref:Uncharacterized protein n=1 Tax=Actinoplanes octamycinicus TaxID=135948 RepID=A0A7W7H4K5_9ACTN|nr:hypothetical protein [Actinoplanes octamycinicus]MBB4743542.1 hypothetical protein [Actinoplanes octamycinicus]GIE62471.1 hypothetical protein Aoc01nite_78730 [Actinoplanes octamycinicus]